MAAWMRRRSTSAPVYDPAFGDTALAEGREDMLLGRWEGARDLLARTPDDWDRRAHRIRLLADAAAGRRTVDLWQASEPQNPDAAVLRAETEVMRLFAAARAGRTPDAERLERAAGLCYRAAELAPADPHPWVSLLTLGRLHPQGHPEMSAWWNEILTRDPYHREGHHQALRYLSARWHGSYGTALNFAWDVASSAPYGSPLAILAQVARAEHYQYRVRTEGKAVLGLTHHWSEERARGDLRNALDKWVAHRVPRAQDVADLNYLAHGLVKAAMADRAGVVFRLLDNRATEVPWSYTGDPEQLFIRWRDKTASASA
ncbi:hypothetical protein OG259_07190 [Streptomyces sp. NBC_00250]|uniref:hypothetical protein n=1 Tax=Streptomyces sp. NBC_00250 TaxID=2903641 RepID=UPI002E2CD058|nr:hypothetical protein [Streptomyces sp. NBC_00250]